jgi:hypothetical protein
LGSQPEDDHRGSLQHWADVQQDVTAPSNERAVSTMDTFEFGIFDFFARTVMPAVRSAFAERHGA